eukprot:TRINITY_DN4579_c1_g1_i2.p1 TRINITY_DN4579_c1_g1~~TRINITY_DN4579_c1_g1_i2.p1  ORF type:complete len:197 (+),score=63.34 TRINITY_DN4579_c1_g1_i2:123-713(+)
MSTKKGNTKQTGKKRKSDTKLDENPKKKQKVLKTDKEKLLKNRKAAQEFRKRQKQHVEVLETEVSTLGEQNTEIEGKIEKLSKENEHVREELVNLREFVSQVFKFSIPQPNFAGNSQNNNSQIQMGNNNNNGINQFFDLLPPSVSNSIQNSVIKNNPPSSSDNNNLNNGFINVNDNSSNANKITLDKNIHDINNNI